MTDLSLLVTAGDGPAECHQAVGHVLTRMEAEAAERDLTLSIHRAAGRHGPKSAVVVVHGAQARAFADLWCGTIQWRMASRLRPNHKRSNWFVGVFALPARTGGAARIDAADVTFATLRAGGPGGQHQNTTDSAVRATHRATGLSVVARGDRSQHRNRALALARLQELAEARAVAEEEQRKSTANRLHHALERGNPVRIFKGAAFRDVT